MENEEWSHKWKIEVKETGSSFVTFILKRTECSLIGKLM